MAAATAYDGTTARVCAQLSHLVYQRPGRIRRRLADVLEGPDSAIRTGPLGNVRVLFVSTPRDIFVVFRGTVPMSIRSVLVNLRVGRKRWCTGRVHRGFLGAQQGSLSFITRNLAKYGTVGKRLHFAGHSQGGAIAYISAVTFDARAGLPGPWAAYTFGQPRAGDAPFARDAERRLAGAYSRIANNRDLFVGVPFVRMGYDHTRDYLHYGGTWLVTRRRQAVGQGWPFLGGSLSDHGMLGYLRRSQFNEGRAPP